MSWFARVGRPLDENEALHIATLLHACGADDSTPVEIVTGSSLIHVLVAEDHDNQWWDAEEGERARLWDVAAERLTESELTAALAAGKAYSGSADGAQPPADAMSSIRTAARNVDGVALDPAIATRAADAAILALHQCGLADLAAAPDDHWFRIKLALFESGRWPLGLRAGRFYLV